MAIETLNIIGCDGAPVPNRFLRHEGPTADLAILLPGMGYSNDRPLMHYASQLVQFTSEQGADVLGVDTVTLIGKSIGTAAMTFALEHELVPVASRCVWLTPLLKLDDVRNRILLHPGPSFIAIGTEDPHYDAAWLAQWQSATGGTLAIVDGGDHGLSIGHDVLRSIAALSDVMADLQDFLRRT